MHPSGKFAYVANSGTSTLSAFSIDPKTGALAPIPGSPFATGSNPFSVAVDPSGKFAYVANFTSNDVSAYSISSNGASPSIRLKTFRLPPSSSISQRLQELQWRWPWQGPVDHLLGKFG